MNDLSPTHVVLLTPPGRAAIATMAIEGPGAISIIEAEFQSADSQSLRDAPPGKLFFGRWNQGQGEEVVVCCRSVELVELSCHGGTTAAASIIRTLVAAGCTSIPWPDWIGTKTPTPIRAQAHIAMSQATTRKTAAILLDQYAGALDRALDQARAAILQQNPTGALQQLTSLLEFQQLGRHLVSPWRVVLAGRPNVGKSSLINALLGYRRAIVLDQPGTTRDAVSAHTALDGWPIELTDTAGLRDATCELESAGVELARQTLQTADLIVLVIEAPAEWTGAERELVKAWPQALCVHNKSDLLQGQSPSLEGLRTSTLTGDGIDDLAAAIIRKLVPRTPPQGAAVPFLPEHVEMIDKARDALIAGEPQAAHAALQSLTQAMER